MRCHKLHASPIATMLVLGMLALSTLPPENYHPLHEAVKKGDLNRIEELIEQGVDVDIPSRPNRITPLELAIQFGQAEAVRLLLKHGADIEPLHSLHSADLTFVARSYGLDIIKLLIEHGLDVNASYRYERWTRFLNMIVASNKDEHLDRVKLLVEAGGRLTPNENGENPLHYVRNIKIAEYLIDLGVDLNTVNDWGETPYYRAKLFGGEELAAFLQSKGAKTGVTIYEAVERGDRERIKEMVSTGLDLNVKDMAGNSPLSLAVQSKNIELVRFLIRMGADFEKHEGSDNPLLLAMEQNNQVLFELLLEGKDVAQLKNPPSVRLLNHAILEGQLPFVRFLLAKGVDFNAEDKEGQSPFEAALLGERMEIVRLLIQKGADIRKEAASNLAFKPERMVEFLLNEGVDINVSSETMGLTALHLALHDHYSERVEYLIDKGADIHAKASEFIQAGPYLFHLKNLTPLHLAVDYFHGEYYQKLKPIKPEPVSVKLLLENGVDINAADEGVTPLHLSIHRGGVELVQLLIDSGADVNVRDKYGHTPLYWALALDKADIVDLLRKKGGDPIPEKEVLRVENFENLDHAKAFFESGGSLQARGVSGETPLHLASAYGNSQVVEWLIKKGADVHARTWGRHTPLHHVNNSESAKLLLRHGAELEARDVGGYTPLANAVWRYNRDVYQTVFDLIKSLVQAGADVNATTDAGQSVLDIARSPVRYTQDTTVVDYLITHGARE